MSKLFTYIEDIDLQILLALSHHDLYTMYHTSSYAKQLINTHPILSDRFKTYENTRNKYKILMTQNINPVSHRRLQPDSRAHKFLKQNYERKLR